MKLRYSLRTLLSVITVLAVVLAFIGTHPHVALGAVVFAYLVLDSATGVLIDVAEAWPEFKKSKVAIGLDGTRARMVDERRK